MENITQPLEMLDLLLLASSVLLALIYFNHYLFCHVSIAVGVIFLFISIIFGESFFECNSTSTIGLYELFISLKSCLPLRPLLTLYISVALLVAALTGYIKVTGIFIFHYFQQHITRYVFRTGESSLTSMTSLTYTTDQHFKQSAYWATCHSL